MFLRKSKVVLGISGGIAAYKAVELIRELQKRGADVLVAVTPNALKFLGEATLSSISGKPVYRDIFQTDGQVKHVSVSSWGDCFVVAPATANTIAKMACGIADNPVTELSLCFGRGIICPSMNVRMYENPITQENLKKLKGMGFEVVEPESGYLACGEEGRGRLAPVEDIVDAVEYWLSPKLLRGKSVLITAGPTREYIDPVRFISNPSSGRMGFSLARAARAFGADVTLITGRVCLRTPYGVKRVDVETVEQMHSEVMKHIKGADIFISSAAVGDYAPVETFSEKIKKGESLTLKLRRTVDILKEVGKRKERGQFIVGFAAETENLIENARRKLAEKNLDAVVANDARRAFESGETEVYLITGGEEKRIEGSKEEVSFEILREIAEILAKERTC